MTDEQTRDINRLKVIWKKKNFGIEFEEFLKWHADQEKECFYCGITEEKISELLNSNKLFTKRLKTRGRRLEFERLSSEEHYSNIDNLKLCCYWCNNAKTDTFTVDEFKLIG
ncbi:MAG TPA: hypothetical protein VGF30_15780, partial [Bacteroidia bacterium]